MDRQTKLFVTTNGETKEIVLSSIKKQQEPLFVFLEYGRCQIELISTEPNARMEVESMNQEGIIKLMPSTPILLSDPECQEEGYVPGNFSLRYFSDQRQMDGFFTVLPQSLSETSLEKMRQLLEEKAQGVTQNRYSHQLMRKENKKTFNELDSLGFLIQHFEELMESLNQISKRPIEDLTQAYQLTKNSKKQTAKSQQWNCTKGNRYLTQETQQMFYEKRNKVTYNTIENRSLKHMIFQISSKILRLNKTYRLNYQSLLQQTTVLETEIEVLNQRKNKMNDLYNLRKLRGSLEHELRIRNEELMELKQKTATHQRYMRQIQNMNGRLMAILNERWMVDLPASFNGRVTQRFLKTPGYSFIYWIYQELTKSKNEGTTSPTFPFHQTSRLFEYYNLFLIIELLQKQGFEWKSGWLKDFNPSTSQTFSLDSEEELYFEDERGYRIRLSYDKFLKTSAEAKLSDQEQMVSVNSISRRPDLLIELFYHQTFLSSMVIEIKYRKLHSIYQELEETNAMKQLMDYRALNYYNPTLRPMMQRNAVDTILTIYPNHQGSRFIHDEVYDFKYIPLSPTGFDLSVEGVQDIQYTLVDFLNRHQIQNK